MTWRQLHGSSSIPVPGGGEIFWRCHNCTARPDDIEAHRVQAMESAGYELLMFASLWTARCPRDPDGNHALVAAVRTGSTFGKIRIYTVTPEAEDAYMRVLADQVRAETAQLRARVDQLKPRDYAAVPPKVHDSRFTNRVPSPSDPKARWVEWVAKNLDIPREVAQGFTKAQLIELSQMTAPDKAPDPTPAELAAAGDQAARRIQEIISEPMNGAAYYYAEHRDEYRPVVVPARRHSAGTVRHRVRAVTRYASVVLAAASVLNVLLGWGLWVPLLALTLLDLWIWRRTLH